MKIFGERNTGTNYLSRLVALNLDVAQRPGGVPPLVDRAQRWLPGDEWLRDLYFIARLRRTLGWKHACPAGLDRHAGADETIFLTLTKNPYAWLLSLYRRPYHRRGPPAPDFAAFLCAPWGTVGRERAPRRLATPVDLWNLKNRAYVGLDPARTLNLTSERLLMAPDAVIASVEARFGLARRSSRFVNHDRSTKEAGKNSAYYRDYYGRERWRDALDARAVALIDARLDRALVARFGYRLLSG